jgi:hypothetical protein
MTENIQSNCHKRSCCPYCRVNVGNKIITKGEINE